MTREMAVVDEMMTELVMAVVEEMTTADLVVVGCSY